MRDLCTIASKLNDHGFDWGTGYIVGNRDGQLAHFQGEELRTEPWINEAQWNWSCGYGAPSVIAFDASFIYVISGCDGYHENFNPIPRTPGQVRNAGDIVYC